MEGNVANNAVICDLEGIFEWIIYDDGLILIDKKYINEWNKRNGD